MINSKKYSYRTNTFGKNLINISAIESWNNVPSKIKLLLSNEYLKNCWTGTLYFFIMAGILSILILSVKNREVGEVLKVQNAWSMTKVICWQSLTWHVVKTLRHLMSRCVKKLFTKCAVSLKINIILLGSFPLQIIPVFWLMCLFPKTGFFCRDFDNSYTHEYSTHIPNKKPKPLSCCHWNVNSLAGHKFLQLKNLQ